MLGAWHRVKCSKMLTATKMIMIQTRKTCKNTLLWPVNVLKFLSLNTGNIPNPFLYREQRYWHFRNVPPAILHLSSCPCHCFQPNAKVLLAVPFHAFISENSDIHFNDLSNAHDSLFLDFLRFDKYSHPHQQQIFFLALLDICSMSKIQNSES